MRICYGYFVDSLMPVGFCDLMCIGLVIAFWFWIVMVACSRLVLVLWFVCYMVVSRFVLGWFIWLGVRWFLFWWV